MGLNFNMDIGELQRKLNDLQSRARSLHGQHAVSLGDIFTPTFMTAHTDCSSMDELLQREGLEIASQSDLDQAPVEELDRAIAAHSHFQSWAEIL